MKTKSLTLAGILFFATATLALAATNDLTTALQKGLFEEEANHNLDAAIAAYQSVATQFDKDRKLAATAIFRLGEVYRKQGKTNEASAQYERILREFSDQPELVKLSRFFTKQGDSPETVVRQLIEASAEYAEDQALLNQLKNLPRQELIQALPIVYPGASTSGLSRLMEQLASAEQALAAKSSEFASEHPDVRKAKAIVKAINTQLDDKADGILVGLKAKAALSKARVEQLQTQLAKAGKELPTSLQSGSKERPELVDVFSEDSEIKRIQAMIKDSPDLINASGASGTPLGRAAEDNWMRVAEFLLKNGADVNRVFGNYTPLHLAVMRGNKAMVELLVAHGANLEIPSGTGATALGMAAGAGFKAIAELLLKNGADVNVTNGVGATPLFSAIASKNLEMARFLIENKADVNARSYSGSTLLREAISSDQPRIVELLLQSGVNIEAKWDDKLSNKNGWSALLFAVEMGRKEIVKMLLDHGANPNFTSENGYTPLHFAAGGGNLEIAELLLARKAGVDAIALGGETPLFWAVRVSKSMVELLLAHKADPNLASDKGETPLSMAKASPESRSKEIVELLIKHGADEYRQRRGQIAVTRAGKSNLPVFSKGTNEWNRFSLLEVYGQVVSNFPFPNLAKVTIHRLQENEQREVFVDLEAILKSGDCSKDVWLEWGDVVEIPEADHKVNERWGGLSKELLDILSKCLARTVSLSVKGEKKEIALASNPATTRLVRAPGSNSAWHSSTPSFWLNDVVSGSGLLRTSSDKTRVTVTRANPATQQREERIFSLEKPDPRNDLWLRDGDVIEIPDRDPNAPAPSPDSSRATTPRVALPPTPAQTNP